MYMYTLNTLQNSASSSMPNSADCTYFHRCESLVSSSSSALPTKTPD